jgi:hypothetical protein
MKIAQFLSQKIWLLMPKIDEKNTGKRSQNSAKSSIENVAFFSLNACGVGEKRIKSP